MLRVLTDRELKQVEGLVYALERKGMLEERDLLRKILEPNEIRNEVSAAAAAQVFHVTPQTVRNWVKGGVVKGRIDRTGHVFVAAEAVTDLLESQAQLPSLRDDEPDVEMDTILAAIEAHRAEKRLAEAESASE